MATFTSANLQRYLIDAGKIFIPQNPQGISPEVYIRSGNNLYTFPLMSLTNNTGSYGDAIAKFNELTGLDYYKLPQTNYDEQYQAIVGSGGSATGIQDLNQFQDIVSNFVPAGDINISQGQTYNPTTGQLTDASGNPVPLSGPASGTNPNTYSGFPTINLEPGATGDSVKQLQDFLVKAGYMTQAQVDTGYGTYGPQTTAAVKALQQALGVDNSTGPGYFGPRTIAALQGSGTTPPTPSTPPSSGTTGTGTTTLPPPPPGTTTGSTGVTGTPNTGIFNLPTIGSTGTGTSGGSSTGTGTTTPITSLPPITGLPPTQSQAPNLPGFQTTPTTQPGGISGVPGGFQTPTQSTPGLNLPGYQTGSQSQAPSLPNFTTDTGPSFTPQQGGGASSLSDFANALDQATQLAKNRLNEASVGIMQPQQGTLMASDFNGILSNLNRASDATAQNLINRAITAATPTYQTQTMPNGDIYQMQYDATGKFVNATKIGSQGSQFGYQTLTGPDGTVYTIQTDASGRPIGQQTLMQGTGGYSYDTFTDATGAVYSVQRDASGKPIGQQLLAQGQPQGSYQTITDPNTGNVYTVQLDAQGKPIGQQLLFQGQNAQGSYQTITAPDGSIYTIQLDQSGKPIGQQQLFAGQGSQGSYQTITAPDGSVYQLQLDAQGKAIGQQQIFQGNGAQGSYTTYTTPDGSLFQIQLDPQGKAIGQQQIYTAPASTTSGTKYVIDQVGSDIYQYQVDTKTGQIIGQPTKVITGNTPSGNNTPTNTQDEYLYALQNGKTPSGTQIGNPAGSDGYVDPRVYLALYDAYVQQNGAGSGAEFQKKYPAKTYINPANTWVGSELLTRGISTSFLTNPNTSTGGIPNPFQ